MPGHATSGNVDFAAVFAAMPGINLLLAADSPRYTMLAASDERLSATLSTREETLGRGVFEVFSDANPENTEASGVKNLRASLEQVLRSGETHRMAIQRYDVRRPDGSWEIRYWSLQNIPIKNADGSVQLILHHVEDVTESVHHAEAERAHEKLNVAAQRLSFLVHASERLAASLDYETTLDEVLSLAVPAIAEWALYTVDAGDGTLRIVASRHADPSKQDLITETARRYPIRADEPAGAAKVIRTGEPELIAQVPDAVLEAVARDAKHLELLRGVGFRSLMTVPVSVRGQTLGALGFVTGASGRTYGDDDLTLAQEIARRAATAMDHARLYAEADEARREAEAAGARLRDVFEQAPVAVAVLTGPEHVYEVVSPPYAASPGLGRQLLGRSVREAFPEIVGTGYIEVMDRVYETGEPFAARERRVPLVGRNAELEDHYFNIGYQPLRDAAGQVYAIASVAYDVTEQVQARHQVEAARAEAERQRAEAEAANRAKSEFLAVMSHELRTPLNAIGGYAELIELGIHGPVTDAQRTALERIQRSQRHLLGLISGVLDYSRVEAGAVSYHLMDVPVTEAIVEAEQLVAPQLREKGLGYSWSGAPPELKVRADREKLQQILLNLLGNAVKFTNTRDGMPGRVEVACTLGTDGRTVQVHVRDTGEGIAPSELERIFEPFVQADQKLTRVHSGVGLGLAISRDLARGMGGNLTAESTIGVGSNFTLSLPRA